MPVVDASVIISALLPGEPHHAASKAWFDELVHEDRHFTAPVILLSEVAAPISRAYEQPELAQRIVQSLMSAPFANLEPVTVPLAHRAAVIAVEQKIRGCDAVYVALAESLDEELITLDKQQAQRAGAVVRTQQP